MALVPLTIVVGMFPHTFPLPTGSRFTREKITFTLSDSIILLVACWQGLPAAVFLAGIEGFSASRRAVRRLTSNLFSAGMMSLAAAAAATGLAAVLRFGQSGALVNVRSRSFPAIAIALLVASVVHIVTNSGLLSVLLAVRHDRPILTTFKENLFVWAAPMFLPNGAAAILLYLTLQYDLVVTAAIGAPVLIAIYLGHRQYHNGVQARIDIMAKTHRETVEALAVAINAKDEVTHEHVLRVQIYAAGVARLLGCGDAEIEALKAGALLHDIGKIAVPDYILNKPGKLTAAEFAQMKTHTVVGAQILSRVEFPYPVVPIVRHHHERWDGGGYPDGLKGEDIPLTARILTVVDCFDALREDRQYRRGLTRDEALDFLLKNSGSQYDPRVVGLFITHLPEFEAEVAANKDQPVPTFGIEPAEQLSEAAQKVTPGAGLAATEDVAQDEVRFSRKELTAVYELVQAVNAAGSREKSISAFTEKLSSIVPYDTCALALIAPATGEIIVEHARGQHADAIKGRSVTLGEGITGWVIANQKPFCNSDPRLDFSAELSESFKSYRTLAAFPLTKETGLHGALTVYSMALAEYDKEHQKMLREAVAVLSEALSSIPHAPGAKESEQDKTPQAGPITAELGMGLAPPLDAARFESKLTH